MSKPTIHQELNDICRRDDLPKLIQFLRHNNPKDVDINGWNALHVAAHYNAIKCVLLLTNLYPDLAQVQTGMGETPLLRALNHKPTQGVVQALARLSQDTPNLFKCKPSDLAQGTPFAETLAREWTGSPF